MRWRGGPVLLAMVSLLLGYHLIVRRQRRLPEWRKVAWRLVVFACGIGNSRTRVGSEGKLLLPFMRRGFRRAVLDKWENWFAVEAPGRTHEGSIVFEDKVVLQVEDLNAIDEEEGDSGSTEVRVRVYHQEKKARECQVEQRDKEELESPVALVFHGGHFVMHSCALQEYHLFCCKLAEQGFMVASVDYRLAPEHPFPTAVEDSFLALAHVVEGNLLPSNADVTKLTLIGFGSGGRLVSVLSSLVRDKLNGELGPTDIREPFIIQHQVIIGEAVDSAVDKTWLQRAYGADEQDRRANPWLAGMHDLPPTTIVTTPNSVDFRKHQAYANHLSQTGSPVWLYTLPDASEEFVGLRPTVMANIVHNISSTLEDNDSDEDYTYEDEDEEFEDGEYGDFDADFYLSEGEGQLSSSGGSLSVSSSVKNRNNRRYLSSTTSSSSSSSQSSSGLRSTHRRRQSWRNLNG